ncbi:energy transducer TonB [Cupriavidus plantarum]|uniref:energy transducer TonB n=1 Tax=Cupriavidus plantarum TaxID=942865 RepID=UPI0015E7F51A|nr:energy transducer TonB [Cupriavidus plantarum]
METPVGAAFSERALYRVPRGSLPEAQISPIREFFSTPVAVKLAEPANIARFSDALIEASSEAFADCKGRRDALPENQINPQPTIVPPSEKLCTAPKPGYPRTARRQGQTGEVIVKLWINEAGLIYLTLIVKSSGFQSLDEAAEESVKAMRCRPYVKDGRPITVTAHQPLKFQ